MTAPSHDPYEDLERIREALRDIDDDVHVRDNIDDVVCAIDRLTEAVLSLRPETPTPPAGHDAFTFGYSDGDDGVWVTCGCGWAKNLGFSGTLDIASTYAQDHAHDRTTEDPR